MTTGTNRRKLSQKTLLMLASVGFGFVVGALLFFFLVPIVANPVVPILIGGLIGAGTLGLFALGVWKFVKQYYKAEPAPRPSAQERTPTNNNRDDKGHSRFYSNGYAASNGPTAESTPSTHVPAYVLPQPKQDAELVKALNEIETLFKKAKSDFATSLIGVEADKIKQEPGFCFSEAQKTELNGHLMATLQPLKEGFNAALNTLAAAKKTTNTGFEEIEAAIKTAGKEVTATLVKIRRDSTRHTHSDRNREAIQEHDEMLKALFAFYDGGLLIIESYIQNSLDSIGQSSGQATYPAWQKWREAADKEMADFRKEMAAAREAVVRAEESHAKVVESHAKAVESHAKAVESHAKAVESHAKAVESLTEVVESLTEVVESQAALRETLAQTNAKRNTAFSKIDAALTRLERQQQENLAANASTDEKQINTMPLVTANDALSPSAAAFLPSLSAAPSSAANDPNASVVVLASALSNGKNYAPTMNGPN